jgi:hypothetical protein
MDPKRSQETLEDLHELLRPFAVAQPGGPVPVEGNELVRLWNPAPQVAAKTLRHHFELMTQNSLGPRLTELVRMSVANSTGCPV